MATSKTYQEENFLHLHQNSSCLIILLGTRPCMLFVSKIVKKIPTFYNNLDSHLQCFNFNLKVSIIVLKCDTVLLLEAYNVCIMFLFQCVGIPNKNFEGDDIYLCLRYVFCFHIINNFVLREILFIKC